MLILSAADVRRALPLPAAIASQRRAFTALATGQTVLPLRTAVPVPDEDAVTLFMPARVAGDLGAKVVSVFPRNPPRGLAMIQGVVLLVDATTGRPLVLMDAASLTALRTGAVSGLATDLLARPNARTAAVLGSGVQAATQLLAICAVRALEHVYVFSRDPQHVAAFISRLQPEVRPVLVPASSVTAAVREADVVCAATTAATPVLSGDDLPAGCHVNAVGAFTTETREVDSATVRRAGTVFVDQRDAALAEAGDVVIPLREGLIGAEDLVELGAVLVGTHPGRTSPAAVTFFKSVGLAVQDVAAGAEVLRRARELGLGVEVSL